MRYDKRALKRLMVARGLGDEELAEKARLASRTVYYLARGMTVPRADTLGKLALALGVEVSEFFARPKVAA